MKKNYLLTRIVNEVEDFVFIKDVESVEEAMIMSHFMDIESGRNRDDEDNVEITGAYEVGKVNYLDSITTELG